MKITSILALLLILSAGSLATGGIFLEVYDLVPRFLTETTAVAVVALFVLSYLVARGNMISINVSTVLGVIAPFITLSTPAHIGVLEQVGSGGLIAFLGVLQLLGFDFFPLTFVALRIVFRNKIKTETAAKVLQNQGLKTEG